jgi:hypothetical protein
MAPARHRVELPGQVVGRLPDYNRNIKRAHSRRFYRSDILIGWRCKSIQPAGKGFALFSLH